MAASARSTRTRPRPGPRPTEPATFDDGLVGHILIALALGGTILGVCALLDQWALGWIVAAANVLACLALIHRRYHRDLIRYAAAQGLIGLAVSTAAPGRPPGRGWARRWTGGWVGHPRRLTLHFAPDLDAENMAWQQELLPLLARRFGVDYRITKVDMRRCRLNLRERPTTAQAEADPLHTRATEVAGLLLGGDAKSTINCDDAGSLASVEASYTTNPRMASGNYRARIEAVFSAMLPGRWRARWDIENNRVRFEIRAQMPHLVPRPPLPAIPDPDRIPLAVGEDGQLISWHLRGTAPHLMLAGKTGTGKMLCCATAVPTPNGWTTMGALTDGDIIFDERGQPCTILKVHPITHDRPSYDVIFSDGSRIVADAEHLWWTETRLDRLSASNRRHKIAYRAAPRPRRLADPVLDRLRTAHTTTGSAAALSIPEIARMADLTPAHPVPSRIAAEVGPSGKRRRTSGAFRYSEQNVWQRQAVATFDRRDALKFLEARARNGWKFPAHADDIRIKLTATDEPNITTLEIRELLSASKAQVETLMRGSQLQRRKTIRQVQLRVPARTVSRRLPGIDITTYPAKPMLERLIAWGEQLAGDRYQPRPGGGVRTTEEIRTSLRGPSGQLNHAIPVASALQYPPAVLAIPPYTLGAWLGDGTSSAPNLTCGDPEIADLIRAEGIEVVDHGRPRTKPDSYRARVYALRGITQELRELGVRTSRTEPTSNKHIPGSYLIAAEQQRRALLAGLLDTDGTVSPSGAVEFCNTNRQLAHDTHELACSLGYRAVIREGRAKLYGRDCGPKWTVSFTTTDDVFCLTRKRVVHRQRNARYNQARNRLRYIVDIRPAPSVPMRCITVDSPSSLYLVGRTFIPTHNTSGIIGVVLEAAARDWPVWACDPKRVEFLGLRNWPNVQIVATTTENQIAVIHAAWREMEARYSAIEAGDVDESAFTPLILVLDEYRDFVGAATDFYASVKRTGMPSKCPVFEKISSLARKGRTARIHLVLGTQRPDSEFLGGEMRDNFNTRMSFGRLSPQGAQMMWENAAIGVSVPNRVAGRGVGVTDDDEPVEIQCYYTPDPRRAKTAQDLADLEQFLPPTVTHPPLSVRPLQHLLDGEGPPMIWEAYANAELVPADPAEEPEPGLPPDVTETPTSSDFDGGYGRPQPTRADHLQPGDLILIDEGWVVVEIAEADVLDDSITDIDWRSDDDTAGSLSTPTTTTFDTRREENE